MNLLNQGLVITISGYTTYLDHGLIYQLNKCTEKRKRTLLTFLASLLIKCEQETR